MEEYISRETAIKSAWMILEGMGYPRSGNRSLERTVESVFKSAPAADVVEVVRCRNCENWDTSWEPSCAGENEYYCPILDHISSQDFYCAAGERKDGGQDGG